MRAFTVLVNGKKLCTAGVGANGVLWTNVTWCGKDGSGHLHMHVGGLDTKTNQHLNWPETEIGVGDEIVTRIIETETVDPPLGSHTRAELEAMAEQEIEPLACYGAGLFLRDSETGEWSPRQIHRFGSLPRIGEWVTLERAGVAVMARILMVVHDLRSAEPGGVDLYAVVEGDPAESLRKLGDSC